MERGMGIKRERGIQSGTPIRSATLNSAGGFSGKSISTLGANDKFFSKLKRVQSDMWYVSGGTARVDELSGTTMSVASDDAISLYGTGTESGGGGWSGEVYGVAVDEVYGVPIEEVMGV